MDSYRCPDSSDGNRSSGSSFWNLKGVFSMTIGISKTVLSFLSLASDLVSSEGKEGSDKTLKSKIESKIVG